MEGSSKTFTDGYRGREVSRFKKGVKDNFSGLRQFLATESPLKNENEKCFLFHLKRSFRSQRYLCFCLDFLVMYRKGLLKKIKANFKFYDVANWLTNNCNTHIAQYFEISDFVSHVCLH